MIQFGSKIKKYILLVVLLCIGCAGWQVPESTSRAPVYKKPVETFVLSEVDVAPRVLRGPRAVYPEIARKAGLTGVVQLKFLIREDGSVSNVQVLRGQEIFRQAAIDVIMKYEFSAPMLNNKPVAVWMTMPIEFRL